MQTIFLTNDQGQPIRVVVEPWAWARALEPGEEMAIDYADLVDRNIEISFQADGSTLLGIPTDGIRIRTSEAPFACGDELPPAPVIPAGLNLARILPKSAEHLFAGGPTKNPPQD